MLVYHPLTPVTLRAYARKAQATSENLAETILGPMSAIYALKKAIASSWAAGDMTEHEATFFYWEVFPFIPLSDPPIRKASLDVLDDIRS